MNSKDKWVFMYCSTYPLACETARTIAFRSGYTIGIEREPTEDGFALFSQKTDLNPKERRKIRHIAADEIRRFRAQKEMKNVTDVCSGDDQVGRQPADRLRNGKQRRGGRRSSGKGVPGARANRPGGSSSR